MRTKKNQINFIPPLMRNFQYTDFERVERRSISSTVELCSFPGTLPMPYENNLDEVDYEAAFDRPCCAHELSVKAAVMTVRIEEPAR